MPGFLRYFFGEGKTEEFSSFGLTHFLPIVMAVALIFVIFRFRRGIGSLKREYVFRYVMAFMLIVCEMSYYWRLVAIPALGPSPVNDLPISVCGWVAVFGAFMLVGKSQSLFDFCYFWSLSGSIFAVLTPTVLTYTGPTRFRYYQFWIEHLLGFVAVFYMIFVHKMRPTFKSFVRAYVGLVILAVVAYCANSMLGAGANYLFIARPEAAPSVLDILPPNFALRLLIMVSAVTALFVLMYLPWLMKDRKKQNVC